MSFTSLDVRPPGLVDGQRSSRRRRPKHLTSHRRGSDAPQCLRSRSYRARDGRPHAALGVGPDELEPAATHACLRGRLKSGRSARTVCFIGRRKSPQSVHSSSSRQARRGGPCISMSLGVSTVSALRAQLTRDTSTRAGPRGGDSGTRRTIANPHDPGTTELRAKTRS